MKVRVRWAWRTAAGKSLGCVPSGESIKASWHYEIALGQENVPKETRLGCAGPGERPLAIIRVRAFGENNQGLLAL